ncbi:putative BKI1/putative membrane-associated kinase regulator/4 [Helianthus annuus]|nr:putative BKI1/putative membrane-associated kinase regulator/4 [Helianthus annuus]
MPPLLNHLSWTWNVVVKVARGLFHAAWKLFVSLSMEVENIRDKVSKEHNYMKKQEPTPQETTNNISQPPPTTTTSPTHEFSFTISLNPPKSTQDSHNNNHHHCLTPPPEPLTAVDLSPADDIFFHGHLLPLHLLSTLPISPRSSTNSIDSFTLPMKEIVKDQQHNPTGNTSFHHRNTFSDLNLPTNNIIQTKPKSKSFSIFKPMLKKGSLDEGGVNNNNNNSNKKLKLEVVQLIKKYMNMLKPFMLFSKTKRANNIEYNRKPHSFSSNFLSSSSSLPVGVSRGGMRRGKFSAPASIRTSPANSGILRASGTLSPAKSTASDSTMEELQAAIQAAIAHCKNSIAIEDKV